MKQTQCRQRGNALLTVLCIGIVMEGMLFFMAYTGMTAAKTSKSNADNSQAVAAAEFAENLAISNLMNLQYADVGRTIVQSDWVGANPFNASGDERRILGTVGDYRYVASVRSLRNARGVTMPNSWLSGFASGPFSYGTGAVTDFGDVYEITAVAKHPNAWNPNTTPPGNDRWLVPDATVRSVVAMSYNTWSPPPYNASLEAPTLKPSPQIMVSGEDHYGLKVALSNRVAVSEITEVEHIAAEDSQLFSVTGTEWSAGRLTAHYRRGDTYNPNIPRTTDFSYATPAQRPTNADHRMIAMDPSKEIDKYIFGGKKANYTFERLQESGSWLRYEYGRSITLDSDGYINENTPGETEPGGGTGHALTALAVGKVEDLLRIYLNFSNENKTPGPTGRPAFNNTIESTGGTYAALTNWRSKWRQAPILFYSKNKMRNNTYRSEMPLDNNQSPMLRHPAIKIWIKNDKGQFLVRDYPSYSGNTPAEKWNGYYVWASYGGYYQSDSAGSKVHLGWPKGRYPNTSYQVMIHTRFLTLEELLGVQVTKDSDGVPAKFTVPGVESSIIGEVPDFEEDPITGEHIPYRVGPGLVTQFDETALTGQRRNTADNYACRPGVNFNVAGDEPAPEVDGIYVREVNNSTGSYIMEGGKKKATRYQLMKDFEFERNIALPGQPDDKRKMVVFHMVIENTLTPDSETVNPSGSRMYFDMGMTVTLVSSKTDEEVESSAVSSNNPFQWWEGERESGLTGNDSRYAVVCEIPDDVKSITDPVEKMEALYQSLGINSTADLSKLQFIYTASDDSGNVGVTFPMAIFDLISNDLITDVPNPHFGVLIKPDTPGDCYYSNNDLAFFRFHIAKDMTPEALAAKTTDELNAMALAFMVSKNPLYTFKHVDDRFTIAGYNETTTVWPTTADPDPASPIKFIEQLYHWRDYTKSLYGSVVSMVPSVYMQADKTTRVSKRDLFGVTGTPADAQPADPVRLNMEFLPGEHYQKRATVDTVETDGHVPFMVNISGNQPDGSPYKSEFYWETDYATKVYAYPTTLPSTLKAAVAAKFGPTDTRGGLGWHRRGDEVNADTLELDHYEYVVMARESFMPYETITADGKEYVQNVCKKASYVLTDPTDTLSRYDDFTPLLKKSADMPTFIFDKPIDGAGILIVYGNLVIRSTFAYSGVLVVFGDMTIEPTLQDVMRLNPENGKPVNVDGKDLTWDSTLNGGAGGYYYMNESDLKIPSDPVYDHTYSGKLVVQGQVRMGGDLTVLQTPDGKDVGIVDIRGSEEAVNKALKPFTQVERGFILQKMNWMNLGSGSNNNLWVHP